jgi:adenine-specific DNA-methyltransferase
LDVGFRVFKLDTSNIRAWNPDYDDLEKSILEHQEHLLPGRSEADVLYEVLLKLGLDLCVPMEELKVKSTNAKQSHTVHSVGGGALIACLSETITREDVETLAAAIVKWRKKLKPSGDTECIFRDSAFADNVAKTNLTKILEQQGIGSVRSL